METNEKYTCNYPHCYVAEDHECQDGYRPIADCPHASPPPAVEAGASEGFEPTDEENNAIIQSLRGIPMERIKVILEAVQAPIFRLVGQAEALRQASTTATQEAAAARGEVKGALQALISSEFAPKGKAVRPDFIKGVNTAVNLHNTAVQAAAKTLGVHLDDITPAPPTPQPREAAGEEGAEAA